MKMAVKQLFPILLVGLGIFFAASVYFDGLLGTENGIYTDAGMIMEKNTETDFIGEVLSDNAELQIEIPSIKYIGGTRKVGESVNFKEMFQFIYQDGNMVQGTDTTYVTIYLSDVEDASGNSVCEKLSTEEIEAMEEISTAFVVDKEQDILYFHKSGSFKVLLKVYYSANIYMEYEFFIPVEVG